VLLPFVPEMDTIGIWRQWEATVGAAQTTSKWLPDDRGLTDPAKRGILHITADMLFDDPQSVGAWFSIEWPVIDADRLPNEPATGLDAYVRAGRIMDVSHGVVLRASPGDTLRRFFEWQMPDAHDEIPVWVDYPSDNPYPIYPVWAAGPHAISVQCYMLFRVCFLLRQGHHRTPFPQLEGDAHHLSDHFRFPGMTQHPHRHRRKRM